jgi:hypothetical protein
MVSASAPQGRIVPLGPNPTAFKLSSARCALARTPKPVFPAIVSGVQPGLVPAPGETHERADGEVGLLRDVVAIGSATATAAQEDRYTDTRGVSGQDSTAQIGAKLFNLRK